ncbi:MAG: Crp/Fnr family transcriptional regulator [Paracoccaceae bacterium]
MSVDIDDLDFFWMRNLPGDLRHALGNGIVTTKIRAGEAIIYEGATYAEDSHALVGLKSGILNFELGSVEQGAHTVHVLMPGTWFGAGQLIEKNARWETIRAYTDCEIYDLSKNLFAELETSYPELWLGVAEILSRNMNSMTNRVAALMQRDSTDRLMAIIRQVSGWNDHPNGNQEYDVPMNQDELAIAANLSPRAIRTILRKLEESGVVRSGYGRVTLLT